MGRGRPGGNPDIAKHGFKKGDPKINRKGQPPKLPNLERLLREVLGTDEDKDSGVKAILTALKRRAVKKGGDRAAEILLKRGYGKTKEHIVIDVEGRKGVAELFPVVEQKRKK